MSIDLESEYVNLKQLLEDLCSFLQNEYSEVPSQKKKDVQNLLIRTKFQIKLRETQKPNEISDCAYVDMESKTAEKEIPNEQSVVYCSLEIPEAAPETIPKECPYLDTPAKNLVDIAKSDYMSWKVKFIFTKIRRIFVVIYNNFLLVYASATDMRPVKTFHLKYYRAEIIENKDKKKMAKSFALVNIEREKEFYTFMTNSYKEMLEWVLKINLSVENEAIVQRNKGLGTEFNQTIDPQDKTVEEAIYFDIELAQTNDPIVEEKVTPPDLPLRTHPELPPVELRPDSIDSQVSYDAVETPNENTLKIKKTAVHRSNSNSSSVSYDAVGAPVFTETKEENIYETFGTSTKNNNNDNQKQEQNVEENEVKKDSKTENSRLGFLHKPKIDVKFSKHITQNKASTKMIMLLAKKATK